MSYDRCKTCICASTGVLTLCGQNLRSLSWETGSQESDAALYRLLVPTQAETLHLSHREFCALLNSIEHLSVTRLGIRTDTQFCEMEPYSGNISVTLSDGQVFSCTATPCFRAGANRAVQVIDTALYLLEAPSAQSLKNKLLKMGIAGMAHISL